MVNRVLKTVIGVVFQTVRSVGLENLIFHVVLLPIIMLSLVIVMENGVLNMMNGVE